MERIDERYQNECVKQLKRLQRLFVLDRESFIEDFEPTVSLPYMAAISRTFDTDLLIDEIEITHRHLFVDKRAGKEKKYVSMVPSDEEWKHIMKRVSAFIIEGMSEKEKQKLMS